MFTILCCNLKDFISKRQSLGDFQRLHFFFFLQVRCTYLSYIYDVLCAKTISKVHYFLLLSVLILFADIFLSIQTFQTVGILFQIEQYKYNLPICRKKDSGYGLYFVEVVFSNKFLNKGRNTNMPKDVNQISWSIDLICFLQFTKLNIQYLACPFIYTVYIGKGLVYL